MKNHPTDLTQGSIARHLFRLAIPTIGASFMQMTYNLTDMLWLGRLGGDAVASVGVAGFYVWFGISALLMTRVGAEIGVSQSLGRKEPAMALRFVRHALFWAIVISSFIGFLAFLFAPDLIGVFGISSATVNEEGARYLRIVSLGFVFMFTNPTFSGIYNGMGNSRSPFLYMSAGVGLNLVLDPILIFGFWVIPGMGVSGAAWATFISQFIVFSIFVYKLIIRSEMMPLELRKFKFDRSISGRIFKLGIPVASESALFAVFAMVIAKMVAGYGAIAIAVQSIGGQIEAISWMTSSGFATALGSYTGQNFGAGNWARIRSGFKFTLLIGTVLGLPVTLLFLFFGKELFSVFLSDPEPQRLGAVYLRILAISQLFMIYEIITRGAFNGVGKTVPPSLTGIVFTGLRIPLALWLMSYPSLGLFGAWWAISITSLFKGTVLPIWFATLLRRQKIKPDSTSGLNMTFLLPTRLRQQFFIKRHDVDKET
jgi:putative MATE family efflux protein